MLLSCHPCQQAVDHGNSHVSYTLTVKLPTSHHISGILKDPSQTKIIILKGGTGLKSLQTIRHMQKVTSEDFIK